MRTLCEIGVLSALLLGLASSSFAQTAQTSVKGTVRDEGGGVLVGARVTATSVRTGLATTVVCDERGAYEFTQLEPGEYTIQAVVPGFRSEALKFTVAQGASETLDITLAIAPLTETVTVTRTDQELSVVPKAVSVVQEEEVQVGQRRVSLNEGLRGIPGVFVNDRVNYSESFGVRLSIRAPVPGIGIGIRGLQLLQDDIPLTMADGISQPGNIDLGSTGQIEVIRGPSSVLYGNSAGGVITLRTQVPSLRPLVFQPDIQFGSYGYERQQLKTMGTVGSTGYLVNVARMQIDGFREHSQAEIRQANAVVSTAVSPQTKIRGIFNIVDMPFGESPSSLDRQTALNSPRSTRQVAIASGLGESSTQGQGGVTLEHRFERGQVLRTTGWAMWRSVWNPIPARIIDIGRTGAGFRLEYGGATKVGDVPVTWTTGFDTISQGDDSVEHANDGVGPAGGRTREGRLLVDQLERVLALGPFVQMSITPKPQWTVTAGVRYDYYDFQATDRLLTDGDQSGGRTLDAFSPTIGLTFAASPGANVYGSFATAYQTPTMQELANRPTGEGGFNPDLEPQDLRTFETGVRGLIKGWRLSYDVAGYVSDVKNALVHYQRADEVEYFRNAGEASRNGIETLFEWKPDPRLTARLAYTYQNFKFDRYVTGSSDFSGKVEPGAPPHQLLAGMTCKTGFGLTSTAQFRWIDAYPVNDANTFSNWASKVVDLRFALDRKWGNVDVRPFLGIDNLFNERYNGSTIPNAFGNRFYEPAPDRQVYVGLTIGAGVR